MSGLSRISLVLRASSEGQSLAASRPAHAKGEANVPSSLTQAEVGQPDGCSGGWSGKSRASPTPFRGAVTAGMLKHFRGRIEQSLDLTHDPDHERLGGVLRVHEAGSLITWPRVGDVVVIEHRGDPALHTSRMSGRPSTSQ
jgi:hypothetical protein